MVNDFKKKILIGLTAKKGRGWKRKLKDINKYGIKKIALFTEEIKPKKRLKLYSLLLKSEIREIPLVHIRDDTTKEEIEFFLKNYKTKYFTIHESGFNNIDKWKGHYKKLYLELNYDNFLSKKVKVEDIGGFCIDLSHFKASEEKFSKEFEYVFKRERTKKYFKCNHLNGYSYKKNCDIHKPKSINDFTYLKTIPKFVLGNIIALEMYNPIKQQIIFKRQIIKLLKNKF